MARFEHIFHDAAIANTETTSDVVNVAGRNVVGFIFPASFDGATVTFTASDSEGGTYVTVKNASDGSSLTVTAGASAFVPVNPAEYAGLQYFKIVSASAMTADRTVQVISRYID